MHEEGYWDFTDEITSKDLAIDSLLKQLQTYKDKKTKIIHKIQLLQMDGNVEVRDLQDILQILGEVI